jgi:CRISPR-associated protein Cas2
MARLWVISYDIANPKRLRAVADVLEQVGERVQESVFECWADRTRIHSIRQQLRAILNEQEDSVRFYPLCAPCVAQVRWQGEGDAVGSALYWIV